MKKLILIAAMAIGASSTAWAERDMGGVLVVRAATSAALQQTVRETVPAINSGRYRGHYNDSCGGFRRSVFAVEVSGPHYRVDRHGNMHEYHSAAIKYSCF